MKKVFDIHSRIKCKNIAELIDAPVIIRVNEFTETSAKEFSEQMEKAHNTGQPIIPVIIDSYGGQVYSLLAMITDIENAKLPVATFCPSKAMSCGAILMTCGTEGHRYMSENASIMIHDVAGMSWGKIEEQKASVQQMDELNKHVYHKMAKNTGQPADHFLKIIHDKSHAEWYLNPKQAKKHKIVNHIKTPEFKVKISLDWAFA